MRVGFVLLAMCAGLGPGAVRRPTGCCCHSEAASVERREPGLLPILSLGAVLLGAALLVSALVPFPTLGGLNGMLTAAVVMAAVGAAIIWRQADDERRDAWRSDAGRARWWRIGGGLALIALGALLLVVGATDPQAAMQGLVVGLVVAAGLALLALPWIRRQWEDANQERAARIREAERAEVAAAVHDSVLQTLTLIRTHADDNERVTQLARAEERRLRAWLYQPAAEQGSALRAALDQLAAQTEAAHPVTVEVVVVGDCDAHAPDSGPARRHRRGPAQRRQACRRRHRVVCRGGARPGRVVRARPRAGIRSGGDSGRPSRGTGVDHRTHGTQRRDRADPHGVDRDGGSAGDADMIRLIIVDDHPLVRSGVRSQLPPDVEVVGEAGDVASAVRLIEATKPDVVLLDVHLPGGDGPAVIRDARSPGTRYLALSVSDAAQDVVAVVRLGARGYVTKSIDAEGLADAIHRVARGEAVFNPKLAGFVLDAFTGAAATSDDELDKLTPREREVMRLIARGCTYREVAAELFVSVKTVETHVSAVLRKLQVSDRHELARWARARNMI